jgi:hypothetical protein
MSGTRVLWGQVLAVLVVVLAFIWAATEWTAWRLATLLLARSRFVISGAGERDAPGEPPDRSRAEPFAL